MSRFVALAVLGLGLALGQMGCESNPTRSPVQQNPNPPAERASYRMYLTTASHSANFATGFAHGIAGADAFCMGDSARPSDLVTAKAMMSDGTNRAACSSDMCSAGGVSEHVDWVFKPGKSYTLADGVTPIATADANGLLPFPLANHLGGSGNAFFTGMAANWQTSGFDCNDYSYVGPGNAFVGHDSTAIPTGTTFLQAFGAGVQCTSTLRVLCVEQ